MLKFYILFLIFLTHCLTKRTTSEGVSKFMRQIVLIDFASNDLYTAGVSCGLQCFMNLMTSGQRFYLPNCEACA